MGQYAATQLWTQLSDMTAVAAYDLKPVRIRSIDISAKKYKYNTDLMYGTRAPTVHVHVVIYSYSVVWM